MSIEDIKTTLASLKTSLSLSAASSKVSTTVSIADRSSVIKDIAELTEKLQEIQCEVNSNVEKSKEEIDAEEADRISVAKDVEQKRVMVGNAVDYIEVTSKELKKGFRHHYVYRPGSNNSIITKTTLEFFDV